MTPPGSNVAPPAVRHDFIQLRDLKAEVVMRTLAEGKEIVIRRGNTIIGLISPITVDDLIQRYSADNPEATAQLMQDWKAAGRGEGIPVEDDSNLSTSTP